MPFEECGFLSGIPEKAVPAPAGMRIVMPTRTWLTSMSHDKHTLDPGLTHAGVTVIVMPASS